MYFWPFIIQFYPTATCFLKTSSYFETSLCFKCDGTSQPHHCQQIHLHVLKKSRITSLWILDFIHLPVDFRWFFVKWLAKPCMNIFLAKLSCTIGTICSDTHPQTLNFKFQNNNFFGNTALQNCWQALASLSTLFIFTFLKSKQYFAIHLHAWGVTWCWQSGHKMWLSTWGCILFLSFTLFLVKEWNYMNWNCQGRSSNTYTSLSTVNNSSTYKSCTQNKSNTYKSRT